MMGTSITSGIPVTQVTPAASTRGASTPTALDSLLPAPEPQTNTDALSELYALMSDARRTGFDASRGNAEGLRARKQVARDRALRELRHAEEKARDAGNFLGIGGDLGEIAKIAAVVAAVGFAVSTGGAGVVGVLAVSGAILSSAAMVLEKTEWLEDAGLDPKTATYVEIGLWVGGAACTGGAGIASLGGSAAATASQLQKVGSFLGSAGTIISGASATGAGYAKWQQGECEGEAADLMADATADRAKAERADRMLGFLLDAIAASDKSDQRALGHVRSAIEAKDGALLMASRRV